MCEKKDLDSLIRSDNSKSKALNDYLSLDDEEAVHSISIGETDPEKIFIDSEQLTSLRKKISGWLSKKEKSIFDLYLKGESYGKIAEELQLSTKSVDNALQRIRRKLRKNISDIPL